MARDGNMPVLNEKSTIGRWERGKEKESGNLNSFKKGSWELSILSSDWNEAGCLENRECGTGGDTQVETVSSLDVEGIHTQVRS